MKTVYLCGGINGLSDDAAKGWRGFATDSLADKFTILDPMARDYRGKEDANVAAIVKGDLADIVASDVLLVSAEKPSWGTAMEVFFAASIKRPVVAVVPGSVSPWLRHHATIFQSMPDAISYIRETWGR